MRDIYFKVKKHYISILEGVRAETKDDLGGFGIVMMSGICSNTIIGRTIKKFALDNPKFMFFDVLDREKRGNLVRLFFSVDDDVIRYRPWVVNTVNPMTKAYKFFVRKLDAAGYETKDLKTEVMNLDRDS
jgi:hypothetical protein